jgi:hypothetical protein
LVVLNCAAWIAAVKLGSRLITDQPWGGHSETTILPILMTVGYVYDTFLSGQPNIVLLALLLQAFLLLRAGRQFGAGALIALAAALKAFPVMAVGWLIYRRAWKATLSMVVCLLAWLLLFPAPFRGFERNLTELSRWGSGMILDNDTGMIGQRPGNSFVWKNQSLIATAHRLLRNVAADTREANPSAPDAPLELLYANVADLSYRAVNVVIVAVALALCLAYIALMPRFAARTPQTDAVEWAMLLILMTIFSPVSWFYYGVWLLYPFMVVVQFTREQWGTRNGHIALVWLLVSLLLLNFVFSWGELDRVRAIGLPFFGYVCLFAELGWILRQRIHATSTPDREERTSF